MEPPINTRPSRRICKSKLVARSGMKMGVLVCAAVCGLFLLGAATQSPDPLSYHEVFTSKIGQKFGVSLAGGEVHVDYPQKGRRGLPTATLITVGTDFLKFRMEHGGVMRYFPLSMVKVFGDLAK